MRGRLRQLPYPTTLRSRTCHVTIIIDLEASTEDDPELRQSDNERRIDEAPPPDAAINADDTLNETRGAGAVVYFDGPSSVESFAELRGPLTGMPLCRRSNHWP
jgi:hypothetical protein